MTSGGVHFFCRVVVISAQESRNFPEIFISWSGCSHTVTDDLLSNLQSVHWYLKLWVKWEIWNLFWNCFSDCLCFCPFPRANFLYPSTVANYLVYQIMLWLSWNRELNKKSWKTGLSVCTECYPVCWNGFFCHSPQRSHKWECESKEGIHLIWIVIKRVKLKNGTRKIYSLSSTVMKYAESSLMMWFPNKWVLSAEQHFFHYMHYIQRMFINYFVHN